jgi:hypothetical protein
MIRYRVPAADVERFLELQRQLAEVYRRRALHWALVRPRPDDDEWIETWPEFRELADELAAKQEVVDVRRELERWVEPLPDAFGLVYRSEAEEVVLEVRNENAAPRPSVAVERAVPLARSLAARMGAVLPAPFSARAQQEWFYLDEHGGSYAGVPLVDLGAEAGAWAVLDTVQDVLTELTTVPWPHDPSRGYVFHEPHAAWRGDELHLWYGEESDAVLRL